MAEPGVVDMDKLAEHELARKSSPDKFVGALEGIKPTSMSEEAQMRELLGKVTMDTLDDTVTHQAPIQEQPKPNPIVNQQPQTPAQVPQKFLKPDGTVDEEKLKTSSENLGKAIEQKQKSIDEMLAEYKANEEKLRQTGVQANNLKQALQPPISEPPPQQVPTVMNQNIPPDQIRAQLLRLQQDDPIAFAVEIARHVARKEAQDIAKPALDVTGQLAEQQRDAQMRSNLLALAEKDPRIQDPALYQEFINELNSDPAYLRLRNPQNAAWNEVKERLRLGELNGSAQPSKMSSPVLGRGVPPSVSSLPQPLTPQTLNDQVRTVNPLSEDGRAMEQAMRELAEQTWRG